jgi:hypothetical protein
MYMYNETGRAKESKSKPRKEATGTYAKVIAHTKQQEG